MPPATRHSPLATRHSPLATRHSPPPTVFVIDDDISFLRSISRLLRASGYQVVIHNSAAEFLAELHPDMNGCVITDLMMPGMDGMALQEALRKGGSPLPMIFLTGHGDIPITVQAMRGGAEDFLTKQAPKADLIAAVNRALARNEQDRAERARLQALRQPFELLTDREREVLHHVVQGKLNKQIAADLGIHERTVKLHRTNLTTKLRVHSVAELTRLVQEAGVFTPGASDH
jgi:FixJ family two-component response regulator